MKYSDGQDIQLGDTVLIDMKYRGTVVAIITDGQFADDFPAKNWSHLNNGILINTDFGGTIHYSDSEIESIKLLRRNDQPPSWESGDE